MISVNELLLNSRWQLTRSGATLSLYPYSTRFCDTMSPGYEMVTNIYQYGPPDTTTPAIALSWPYNGNQIRLVYESDGDLNITSSVIVVSVAYTSGRSSWTLFELKNFQGRTNCLTSTAELHRYSGSQLGLPSVGSVCKGCGCTG